MIIIYVRTWNTERLSFGESKEQLSSFIKKNRFQGEEYKKFTEKKEKTIRKKSFPLSCYVSIAGQLQDIFYFPFSS